MTFNYVMASFFRGEANEELIIRVKKKKNC